MAEFVEGFETLSRLWAGLLGWIGKTLLQEKMITVEDLDMLKVVDTPEEVLCLIEENKQRTAIPPTPLA